MRPPPSKTQDKKYKTRMCRYGAGTCPYGVGCSYAHSAVARRAEKSTLRAVDAKAGRPAHRRSSGRSSRTSRRASRPTSSVGSSGSAPSATAVASRRPSSRSSSSRSCASRARSRPRPRRCWRRRRRRGGACRRRCLGACRHRHRTPTCYPRWQCLRARCRDRRRTPRGHHTSRCRAAALVWRATVASASRHAAAAVRGSFAAASSWLRVSVRGSPAATAAAGFWVRAWRLATLRRFAPVNANRRRLSRLAALFLRVPALCPLSPPHAMPRGCFKRDPGRKLEYCRRHLSMPFGASWGENALWPKIKLKSIGRISSRRASLPN